MLCVEERTRLAIKNILLAAVFSEPSEAILSYAVSLAHRYGSKMSLTGAVSASTICQIIEKGQIDLVVLGAQVRESRTLGLDTVIEEILRKVSCPILIIGPRVTQMELAKSEVERIVYVTDYTISSLDGVPYTLAWSRDHDAQLKFVHVAEGTTMGPFHFGNSRIVAFRKRLESLVGSQKGVLQESDFAVQEGDRAEGLVRIAAKLSASMIVMSARGNVAQLLWPRASQLVCQAHCPVLIVRGFR